MQAKHTGIRLAVIPFSFLLSNALPVSTAHAEVTLDLGLNSQYLREGITQTGNSFSYNLGLNWLHSSGFYAGAWASRLDRTEDDLKLESDYFAGFYKPLNENVAINTSLTHYQFHGDNDSFYQDYSELGVSLLLKDRCKLGWRGTHDYLGTERSWQAIDLSYVFPIKDFNVEVYLANYRWLNKDRELGAHYDSKSHYWHFRVAAERTWKNWDYKFSFERAIVGGRFDGGTRFVFGINRHFKLFQ